MSDPALADVRSYLHNYTTVLNNAVEPLLKDTPEIKTPPCINHTVGGPIYIHTQSYKTTPELRTPLYKGQTFIP